MHIVTFIFVNVEIVIFFYLLIYKLARPDNKITSLNISLIILLMFYNITGGLLPDPNLPGSPFIQLALAYFTGFITPCYFPYYVYKAFGLKKMKFHAFKGVYLFLILPYFVFIVAFAITNNIETAKKFLVIPLLYALWVIYSLAKAINFKYKNRFASPELKEEVAVIFLAMASWVGLPVIDYFDLGQGVEVSVANSGFLLLLALQIKRHIRDLKIEHQMLIKSEKELLHWNKNLKNEVDKRTKELELINEQKSNTFINLAHETKTPLTLINNYLEEYITAKGNSIELSIIKKNIEKLSNDIVNFFDMEKFHKNMIIYNHNQVTDFSDLLKNCLVLFTEYAKKREIVLEENIENKIFIKADPVAINRIVNNIIENAIKFSRDSGKIEIVLKSDDEKIIFSVRDFGQGVPEALHKKVFEPYYQITNVKRSNQGIGLGLPIVKKIVQGLNGDILLQNNVAKPGILLTVSLNKCEVNENKIVGTNAYSKNFSLAHESYIKKAVVYDKNKQNILIVEDNYSMVSYLINKLATKYNVYSAQNGDEALKKLRDIDVLPDLIISDIMMDKVDGYEFVQIISNDPHYSHIPFIFLSAKSAKDDKLRGLRSGAIDFIQKPFNIHELLQKIESILTNVTKYKQALLTAALHNLKTRTNPGFKNSPDQFLKNCDFYRLTSREKDIVKLIHEGYNYKTIGATLFISERTVTKHVQNIFEKMEVSNKIKLINKLEAS